MAQASLAAWATWAKERGFEIDGHDAAYAGMVEGIPVYAETGIRDTGRYEVVVTLPIASGLAPVLIRRGTRSESASRIHHALEELVGDLDELRCASIHEDDIELRFRAGTSPDIAVDGGARAVIDAWRSIEPSTSGAYR